MSWKSWARSGQPSAAGRSHGSTRVDWARRAARSPCIASTTTCVELSLARVWLCASSAAASRACSLLASIALGGACRVALAPAIAPAIALRVERPRYMACTRATLDAAGVASGATDATES